MTLLAGSSAEGAHARACTAAAAAPPQLLPPQLPQLRPTAVCEQPKACRGRRRARWKRRHAPPAVLRRLRGVRSEGHAPAAVEATHAVARPRDAGGGGCWHSAPDPELFLAVGKLALAPVRALAAIGRPGGAKHRLVAGWIFDQSARRHLSLSTL